MEKLPAVLGAVSVTYQAKKGFKKMIGHHAGEDGVLRPKVWWFGSDERAAVRCARLVLALHGQFQAEGMTHWTSDAIDAANGIIKTMREGRQADLSHSQTLLAESPTSSPVPTPAQSAPKEVKTLHHLIDAYLAVFSGKPLSGSHKAKAAHVLGNVRKVRKNIALGEIGHQWIEGFCDHYKSRPMVNGGRRMSPATVKNIFQYVRAMFVWADDVEYGEWQAPRKLMKLFRFKAKELLTPTELRASKTIKQIDIATIARMCQAADQHQKAIIWTAIFLACTQQELAVLEKSEFDLHGGIVEHYRNKTSVEGRYWIPPELCSLLKQQFARRPGDTLAFRTNRGNPLVHYENSTQNADSVRLFWEDLRITAELPDCPSFKFLRKFTGDYAARHGGESMGQAALAHAPTSILGKHYSTTRDWEGLHAIQRRLYGELKAAGVFSSHSLAQAA